MEKPQKWAGISENMHVYNIAHIFWRRFWELVSMLTYRSRVWAVKAAVDARVWVGLPEYVALLWTLPELHAPPAVLKCGTFCVLAVLFLCFGFRLRFPGHQSYANFNDGSSSASTPNSTSETPSNVRKRKYFPMRFSYLF